MNIHYYEATSPIEAFTKAAKDTKNWDFPTMEAFEKMANRLREGFQPTNSGQGYDCVCESGYFRMYPDKRNQRFGIGVVSLIGREAGIDHPAAQEILSFHRDRLDQPLFAVQLLDCSSHIDSLAELDSGYALLLEARLIEQTNAGAAVDIGGQHLQRSLCVVRSRRS